MRALVTGGAGFIGSHLVEHFQGRAEVLALDNLRTGHKQNLKGLSCEFVEGSITERATVRKAMQRVDYVFHLAAMISVPESMTQPIECVRINTEGTLIVLEEAAAAGVRKLVFSSSAAIYGDNPVVPKKETMLPEPKSPYAVTKLDGEYYCRMFANEGRLNTVCLRYFNVFGPRQDPAGPYAAAIPIFIRNAREGRPLRIFGDGAQTRDFIFVKDIARANEHLALLSEASGVFNVACGGSVTIEQLARRIVRLLDSPSAIVHEAPRPGDVRHSTAAVERLSATGFTPRWSFDQGLQETLSAAGAEAKNERAPIP